MMSSQLACVDTTAITPSGVAAELRDSEQTLLGPLHERAADARHPLSLLHDAWSLEISMRLAYDFSRLRPPTRTAVVRTQLFDRVVGAFLAAHPTATLVELGAGLGTRFERLDNGTVRWFDVDRPRVVSLRRRLLPVSGRRMHVASSILERGWDDLVATTAGPHCFVFEAVLGYLPCDAIRPLLTRIAARFSKATIVFDLHPRWIADRAGTLRMADGLTATVGVQDVATAIERWQIGQVVAVPFLGYSRRAGATELHPRAWTVGWPRMMLTLRAR